jgi:hypothetical protein
MKKLFSVLPLLTLAFSVGVSAQQIAKMEKVILSTTTELASKDAIKLYLGKDDANFCEVAVTKQYLEKQKGHARNESSSQPEVSGSCSWGGKDYVISSRTKSWIDLKIQLKGEAGHTVLLEGKMVNPNNQQEYINVVTLKGIYVEDLNM